MNSKLFNDAKLKLCVMSLWLTLVPSYQALAQVQPPTVGSQQPSLQQHADQIAYLNGQVMRLTDQNRRFMESAQRCGWCLTAAQNEALAGPIGLANYRGDSRQIHVANVRLLNMTNNCQRQFTDTFK